MEWGFQVGVLIAFNTSHSAISRRTRSARCSCESSTCRASVAICVSTRDATTVSASSCVASENVCGFAKNGLGRVAGFIFDIPLGKRKSLDGDGLTWKARRPGSRTGSIRRCDEQQLLCRWRRFDLAWSLGFTSVRSAVRHDRAMP
jgi:hypothetical protein